MTDIVRTKILVTLGPATDSVEKIKDLIKAGADGIRLNFSHGNFNYFEEVFTNINQACIELSVPIPILIDLQGPKIRVGEIENGAAILKSGETIKISSKMKMGNSKEVSTTYKELINDSKVGNKILLDDGLIQLEIVSKKRDYLICKIIDGGILRSKKGMNLPGMNLSTSSITEKDFENLEFALKHRVDFIALSFVRKAEDIARLKTWLSKRDLKIPVIAKIEKPEAVNNFDSILELADGIMVARGDLGVEMEPYEVPIIQKKIISKCNAVGKFVITATQMLESMINNPMPTRAEASDVANAVLDGTDVVMLSGETSIGSNPIDAVEMMNNILMATEKSVHYSKLNKREIPDDVVSNIFDAAGRSVSEMAEQVNSKAIVSFTHFGRKAKVISKYRPMIPIIAVSDNFEALNNLNLYWGVIPIFLEEFEKDEEASIKLIKKKLIERKIVKKKDLLLFTAGAPHHIKGRKHWVYFEQA